MEAKTIVVVVFYVAIGAIAPVVGALYLRLFSVPKGMEENSEGIHARNNWIEQIACWICLASFVGGIFLYLFCFEDNDPLGVGLQFGTAVIGPVLWIVLATLPQGIDRFREFWRFYQVKYKMNIFGVLLMLTPFVLIGIYSYYVLINRILEARPGWSG